MSWIEEWLFNSGGYPPIRELDELGKTILSIKQDNIVDVAFVMNETKAALGVSFRDHDVENVLVIDYLLDSQKDNRACYLYTSCTLGEALSNRHSIAGKLNLTMSDFARRLEEVIQRELSDYLSPSEESVEGIDIS